MAQINSMDVSSLGTNAESIEGNPPRTVSLKKESEYEEKGDKLQIKNYKT